MTARGSDGSLSLPHTIRLELEGICDRFEAAWKSGQEPPIADHFADAASEVKGALLRELIRLDIDYRRRCGQTLCVERYLQLAPESHDVICEICEQEARDQHPSSSTKHDIDPPADSLATTADDLRSVGSSTVLLPQWSARRFRILAKHAEGGLGEVFLAQDHELNREVALKRIKSRFQDVEPARARFAQEGKITGHLEHPGIVPIYSLGQSSDARPFYAMRFIRGESMHEAIARFHERHANSLRDSNLHRTAELRQLLGRFVQVCNAVAYAHTRGVIHRDIKPGNMMLGDFSETLLVDWGVAKHYAHRPAHTVFPPSDGCGEFETQQGDVVGTPSYMSPEQAAGDVARVGPASDVYGLGASLYALLVGTSPFSGKDKEDIPTLVQRGEFAAPRAANPQAKIPRPLEAITLKAMARRPEDRYATAAALTEDIERWLADEPVTAWNEPLPQRARRWARKHPRPVTGSVAAALVGLVSLAIAMTVVGKKNYDLTVAMELVEERTAQTKRSNELLASIFLDLDPRQERLEGRPLRAILADRLERVASEIGGEVLGSALPVAQLQTYLGISLRGLGFPEKALELHRKALYTRRDLLGPDSPETLHSMVDLAVAHSESGQLEEALPLYEDALEGYRATLSEDHPDRLRAMNGLASAYADAGQLSKAIPMAEHVLQVQREALGGDDVLTLNTMNNLGCMYQEAGQVEKALSLHEATFEAQKTKFGQNHFFTRASLGNLARTLLDAGHFDKALPMLKQNLEQARGALGDDHPVTMTAASSLALGHKMVDDLEKALPMFEEVLERRRAKQGFDHPDTLTAMNNLATAYQEAGQLRKALPLLEQALERQIAVQGQNHPSTLNTMNNLAAAYQAAGQLEKAVPLYQQTLHRMQDTLGEDHSETIVCMANLGTAYSQAGQYNKAFPLLEQALQRHRAKLGEDHPGTLRFMQNLGSMYLNSGEAGKGLPLLEQAFSRMQATLGADHSRTLDNLWNLGAAHLKAGHTDKALPLLQEAHERTWATLGADHPSTHRAIRSLSLACLKANQPHKALPLFERYLDGQRKLLAADPQRLAVSLGLASLHMLDHHQYAAAEANLRECLKIREELIPDNWLTFLSRSMLGDALAGQQQFAEAEPLLLQGYQGMADRADEIPAAGQAHLAKALRRLVHFYDARELPREAAKWRQKLQAEEAKAIQNGAQPPGSTASSG